MRLPTESQRIEMMLRALIDDQLEWVGGYVHGRTERGDPFIILYPASNKLNQKVCRVYDHMFKRLPDWVDTDVPAGCLTSDNPTKDKAQRVGIYHECQPFEVLIKLGKDTSLGKERRFAGVLRVGKPLQPTVEKEDPQPAGIVVASDSTLQALTTIGQMVYGLAWPQQAKELAIAVSEDRTNDIGLLTEDECNRLLKGINKKHAQQQVEKESSTIKQRELI